MRSRSLAWSGLTVGGLLGLVVAAQAWWTVTTADFTGTISGTESTSSLAMVLGIVVAAGLLLMLTLRHRGRQVLGVLLALVGVAMVAVGVRHPAPTQAMIDRARNGLTLDTQGQVAATVWPWLYALAGLIVIAASVLTVIKAASWPRPVDRYARMAGRAATRADDDPAEVWKAMDAGYDPTDSSEPHQPDKTEK